MERAAKRPREAVDTFTRDLAQWRAREQWIARAWSVAPQSPDGLIFAVGAALSNPQASSDALLCLADALDEAAEISTATGLTLLARDLCALAELPRQLAPTRAASAVESLVSTLVDPE